MRISPCGSLFLPGLIPIVVLCLVFPLFLPSPLQAQPAHSDELDEITLHLKWKHAFQFAGFYAAQSQGFFRDEGLEVLIKEPTHDDSSIDAVLEGRAQFGVWGADLLNMRLDGEPVVALGVVFQHSPYAVISLWETGIRGPADLAGKTVEVESKMGLAQLQAILLREGLPLTSVNLIPHSWSIDGLIAGEFDATFSYITDQPDQLQMRGAKPSVLLPINYGIDFYGDTIFTTEKQIQEHPEQVKAFRRACFKGWEYAMGNVEPMIDLILEMPGVTERGLTRQHLQYEALQMQDLVQPQLVELGHMNPGRWQRMADLQVQLGMIEPGYSLEGFLYDPNPPQDQTWLRILLACLAVVGLIAILATIWNFQMRKTIVQGTADLRQSEQQLRLLFESAPVCLWLEDFSALKIRFEQLRAEGITDFRDFFRQNPDVVVEMAGMIKVLEVNQEAVYLHKARDKKDLLSSLTKTFTEKSYLVFTEELIALAEGMRRFEADGVIQTLEGKEVPVFVRLFIGENNEDWSKTYLALMDISERKKAEERAVESERQIQHSQKLESLGVLAGGIAHDFNNLLMVILGHADLALDSLSASSPAVVNLGEIHSSSRRAADLCQQMLAYSGRGHFEIKEFDLNELTREMAHLLQTVVPKKVTFNWQLSTPGPVIRADVAQIQQVVMNLITNASEAIGDLVGTVTLRTGIRIFNENELEESRLTQPPVAGEFAVLEVIDDGEGMNQETLDNLFDPFFTTKFTGRGLGLSAVLGIVRGHSGSIMVHSRPGQGSTFRVLFPLAGQSPAVTPKKENAAQPSSSWQGEGVVLLADDEPDVRKVAGHMLKVMGFEVEMAEDGHQAVEQFRENPNTYTLVILDLTMPRLSGEEALHRIREINAEVPILMTSGYSQDEVAFDFSGRSSTGFIQKPFTMNNLGQKICRLVDQASS